MIKPIALAIALAGSAVASLPAAALPAVPKGMVAETTSQSDSEVTEIRYRRHYGHRSFGFYRPHAFYYGPRYHRPHAFYYGPRYHRPRIYGFYGRRWH